MRWVELEIGGVRWLVSSTYVAPAGVADAERIARENGAELATPAIVDAIWRAADLKLEPIPMWPNLGDNEAQFREHAAKIAAQIGGRPFRLLAGTHKDVVRCSNGHVGIYGWHRTNGKPIQDCNSTSHPVGSNYKDYSQGVRLVRRVTPGSEALAGAVVGGAAGALAFGWVGASVGALVGAVGALLVKR